MRVREVSLHVMGSLRLTWYLGEGVAWSCPEGGCRVTTIHYCGISCCSTPGGVLVGFAAGPNRTPLHAAAVQRPKASWSGSQAGGSGCEREQVLLNARRHLGRVHGELKREAPTPVHCSTPEGILVGFTGFGLRGCHRGHRCSTPEGILVGFTTTARGYRRAKRLLNARRHLGRVHGGTLGWVRMEWVCCSTPEGILVGFTRLPYGNPKANGLLNARRHLGRVHRRWRRASGSEPHLLNARRHLGRVHGHLERMRASWYGSAQRPKASWSGSPSTSPTTTALSTTAQRPKASWSGSRRGTSTRSSAPPTSAQRPKASWSGSSRRPRKPPSERQLLNARRHLGRVHGEDLINRASLRVCSTPEGILVGFTSGGFDSGGDTAICSTPEGILVGFTARITRVSARVSPAQRPKASWSGSRR